jgi:hypothetical protein
MTKVRQGTEDKGERRRGDSVVKYLGKQLASGLYQIPSLSSPCKPSTCAFRLKKKV